MAEHTNESEHYGPPAIDVFISAMGALVIGSVIWAGGYLTVLGINYGLETFGLALPANPLINGAIQTSFVAVPILAGLVAAWLSYRFLLKLD